MITKVSKISEELYQINDSDTPIDSVSLRNILKYSSDIPENNVNTWLDTLNEKKENQFEVTSNKGTVVNIYEVDYPQPSDPNKETQEMSKHLDEYEDAVSQNLFPGVPVEDILVTTQDKVEGPGRFFTEKELRDYSKNKNVKKGWRQILGDTTTAPAPTKTPTKIPTKVPEKNPKVNPFRKPDHIKPSQEPQPKALPVTYPQGTRVKMHPELEQTINEQNTPYHALPQLPGGKFLEDIASERFKIILRNLERYSGKRVTNLQEMMFALMTVLKRIHSIEQEYIPQLEDLAVSLVEQHFGINPEEVGLNAKLVRNVDISDITNISSPEEKSIEETISNTNVDLEVSKRRFINGMIQGASINSLNMFHLVRDELQAMDPDLINMYGLLTTFAEIGYWVIPPAMIGQAAGGVFGGGKVKLDFSQETPEVIAVALNFPILVQELVKGVMELMSSHGLPEDTPTREQVLKEADTLEDESWDIRFGPEIWKKLLSYLNINDINGRALSVLYYNLVRMDAATFSDFVNRILSNDQNSINKWNQMYEDAKGLSNTSSFEFQNEEELLKEYDMYRRETLRNGDTPALYYDWLILKEREGMEL